MSVPVVVVVHGNQGPNSEATIIWDNMFSVPVSIIWSWLWKQPNEIALQTLIRQSAAQQPTIVNSCQAAVTLQAGTSSYHLLT